MNAIDPFRLKSTDTLDPESSQRRRTQLPFDADLALLSFAGDSSVLKSITGTARDEYRDLARSVSGASSLRLTTPAEASQLPELLAKLVALATSEDYLQVFPDVAYIRPISDPAQIDALDAHLVPAVFDREAPIVLSRPEIIDYLDESYVSFSGAGASEVFVDIYIRHYREYLEQHGETNETLTPDALKRHRLLLLDSTDEVKRTWSSYRCLLLEVSTAESYSYHLSDGLWYKVADSLVTSLRDYLNPYWIPTTLPAYTQDGEAAYNTEVGKSPQLIYVDRQNIAPPGQHQVEPCDLLQLSDTSLVFIHVKLGTSSGLLSHLFNQGANSVQLIRTEHRSMDRLVKLIEASAEDLDAAAMVSALQQGRYSVQFAIITHKRNLDAKSDNLPFFSRISLRREISVLRGMGLRVTVQFVPDRTNKAGRKKARKSTAQTE